MAVSHATILTDPKKMEEFRTKAGAHAGPVAALDAASFGLASKSLLPAALKAKMSAPARVVAETAVQMPVQGAMGGAGEALGQIAAEGRVMSWSDVWAEVIGEHFTAPVEIATAGRQAFRVREQEIARAQQRAEGFKAVGTIAKENALITRAPEVAEEYLQEAAEDSGVSTVYIDAESLHQSGLAERLVEISPTAAAQMEEALRTGGEIAIPAGEYLTRVATTDLNEPLVPFMHFADEPSLHQTGAGNGTTNGQVPNNGAPSTAPVVAQTAAPAGVPTQATTAPVQAQGAIPSQAQSAPQQAPLTPEQQFKQDLKDVGNEIDVMLGQAEITDTEKHAVQGLLMSLVQNAAQDLGISPKQFWADHGLKYTLGPNNAAKAQGLSGNSLHMAIPEVFGPVFTGFERKPAKAVEHLLKEKKGCCPGVFYHKKLGPIGLAYGRTIEGDPEDRGGYGLAHMEKKHPGSWKLVQTALDNGRLLGEEEGAIQYADKLRFVDGETLVVLTKYWDGDKSAGSWVMTSFEARSGKRYIDQVEKKS